MKKMMLVMMYGETGFGKMFTYNFDEVIKLEISKTRDTMMGSNVTLRGVVFDELKTHDILTYLTRTINDLYEPDRKFYTICESGKNFIIGILEALKQKCGVPFGEELQKKYDFVIQSLESSVRLLKDASPDCIREARAEFDKVIIKERNFENEVEKQMHEDGHPFTAIGILFNHNSAYDEANYDLDNLGTHIIGTRNPYSAACLIKDDIPEDLTSFKAVCIGTGGMVYWTSVTAGKIVSQSSRGMDIFMKDIFERRRMENKIFVISQEDITSIYRNFIFERSTGDKFLEEHMALCDFMKKCIPVNIEELFKDEKDKGWDSEKLAKKFLEDKEEEAPKKVLVIVDGANVAYDGNGILDECAYEIFKDFGIDKDKLNISSIITVEKDTNAITYRKNIYEALETLLDLGLEKVYVDANLESDKEDQVMIERLEFVLKEIKTYFPNVDIEYKG